MKKIQIIECPRDAMQGIKSFIPTDTKIEYINKLLQVGFDILDFGSFVSPKAIPQMQDTDKVLEKLHITNTKLLAIIANAKGAENAGKYSQILYLGFPFSVSQTFQLRNTNSTLDESLLRLDEIQNICLKTNKKLLVYLSMAFGNPYGDVWHEDIVTQWAEKISSQLDVKYISFADTIGVSNPQNIERIFNTALPVLHKKNVQVGAHLHSTPDAWKEKLEAVLRTNCNWLDGAVKGFGGCPMAKDELTGNMPTEKIIDYLQENNYELKIDRNKLLEAIIFAEKVFNV